jgi:hypothetical protein
MNEEVVPRFLICSDVIYLISAVIMSASIMMLSRFAWYCGGGRTISRWFNNIRFKGI